MRSLTLGLAALTIAVPLAPAQAIDRDGVRGSRHSERFGNFAGAPVRCDVDRRDGRRGDGRRRGGGGGCIAGGSGWYGGEWALYNNRSWESDSYNDWWHDEPNHSQPAWVRNNQDCQRQWFAGDTLRC